MSFFRRLHVAAVIAVLACQTQTPAAQQTHADLILENAWVYTMDAPRRWAQAIAVANGRIVAVGANQDMDRLAGPLTRIVDLQGKMVMPSFHDSHVHPVTSQIESTHCSLNELETKEQILKTIATYAEEHPVNPENKNVSQWILGGGWALPIFGAAGPRKEDLDTICPDRPVCLDSADGHSSWVNSKALELAGVTKSTPDPANGRIERGPDNEPTGTLREDAEELVTKLVPQPTEAEYREAVLAVQKQFNEKGITGVIDADVSEPILKGYASVNESNLLTMRVLCSLHAQPGKGIDQITQFMRLREKYTDNLLKVDSVKLFMDGVIEAKTASLLEPYVAVKGEPSTIGILNWQEEELNKFVTALEANGFQAHFHAIGDRAVRAALNAIAWAQNASHKMNGRHHIAHLELIHPDDLPRFCELNVTANFQPFWAYRDKYMSELTEPVLGPERSARIYPIHSMATSGATMAAGSDWSVSTFDPLECIQVAVTRCGLKETADKSFLPQERASLPEILAAYTIGGAYVAGDARETGSLEVGKSADLIIIDKNLFAIPPAEIHNAKVLVTYLRGREVFRHPTYSD